MGIRDFFSKASARARQGGGTEMPVQGLPAPLPEAQTTAHTVPPGPYSDQRRIGQGSDWFGAGPPMTPAAPPEVAGRRFDFPSRYNLNQQPRAYEPISFADLRGLAEGYDIMRLVIETRKDQMTRLKWNIVPRDDDIDFDESPDLEKRAKVIEAMFRRPDRENYWSEWLRMIMEDLLVIDAPAIHIRRTLGGDIYSLDPIDGATIKVVIDNFGRKPEPPYAAYQQVLKGMPAINYSKNDLIYRPRNPRTHKVYGYSPVEQVIMTVQIALRREMWQLAYFTDGNIPDSLIGVPSTWTPDQIRQFQDWFDGLLQGNIQERRRARFVPGEVAKSYVPTKEAEIFGAAEEWLVRVICFAFGVSPQPFLKMMNRATAQTSVEEAVIDGLAPLQVHIANTINAFLEDQLDEHDLMFRWEDDKELDPQTLQTILSGYVKEGIITRNEARNDLGRDPDESDEADMLMVDSVSGPIPLSTDEQIGLKQKMQDAFPPPPPTVGPDGKPVQSSGVGGGPGGDGGGAPGAQPPPKPGGEKPDPAAKKIHPADHLHKSTAPADRTPISVNRPRAVKVRKRLARKLKAALADIGEQIIPQVRAALEAAGVSKAEQHGEGATITDASVVIDLDAMVADLDIDWRPIIGATEDDIQAMYADAGQETLAMIGVEDRSALVDQVSERSVTWAQDRSAELVGKRVLSNGDIVDNPDAKWAIDESTRTMIRDKITDVLATNAGSDEIIRALEEDFAFSPERADMVSRTEVAYANSSASRDARGMARAVGVKLKKQWIVGQDPCDECSENADAGAIDDEETFPSGDDDTPAHPNCECAVIPVVEEDSGDEADDESDDEGD